MSTSRKDIDELKILFKKLKDIHNHPEDNLIEGSKNLLKNQRLAIDNIFRRINGKFMIIDHKNKSRFIPRARSATKSRYSNKRNTFKKA